MSKREIYICDFCGNENEDYNGGTSFFIAWQKGPADNPSKPAEFLDLCDAYYKESDRIVMYACEECSKMKTKGDHGNSGWKAKEKSARRLLRLVFGSKVKGDS